MSTKPTDAALRAAQKTKEWAAIAAEIRALHDAAPDLLEACERYRDACSCQSGGFDGEGVCAQPCDLCDFASAAIAKATVQNPPQNFKADQED